MYAGLMTSEEGVRAAPRMKAANTRGRKNFPMIDPASRASMEEVKELSTSE